MPEPDKDFLFSPAVQHVTTTSFGVGSNLTWDAFYRQSYRTANQGIQAQANLLLKRGNVTAMEARLLVEGQRNALVVAMRNKLSPFGRLYSEILKPSSSLPSLNQLVAKKGSIEAVLTSVGKSRAAVNRMTAMVRMGGPATIVLQITFSGLIIANSDPEARGKVASGQAGSIAGAALGGWGGAWAGCGALAAIASPSLVIPIVGEVTTGAPVSLAGSLVVWAWVSLADYWVNGRGNRPTISSPQ